MNGRKHRPQIIEKKQVKNTKFLSKNGLQGMSLSRRDDIISLVYLMDYLMNEGRWDN